MKTKITLILSALVMSINLLFAQSPGTINYQGVARDTSGNPIANQQIRLRFKILDNAVNGPVEFTEVRKVTTSASGLFNCQIGGAGAISQSASLQTLPWHDGNKVLKVEMDPTGGMSYTNMGTQLLASVPYALNSMQTEKLAPGKFLPLYQLDTTYAQTGNFMIYNGYNWSANSFLPYVTSDQNALSFGITNQSAVGGTAIYGKATTDNTNATGVRGETTGQNGKALYGKSVGKFAYAVYGENTNGIGVFGISDSLSGVHGITKSQNSAGVFGFNYHLLGNGIHGKTGNGSGVYGESTGNGNGIKGTVVGPTGNGVYGEANYAGCVALKGVSNNGYALETNGKLKLTGGNTNPGKGKVLTSDSLGNATWEGAVAFSASPSATTSVTSVYSVPVACNVESYDLSNNYNTATQKFTAPVNGIYHFDANISWAATQYAFIGYLILQKTSNGNFSGIAETESNIPAQSHGTNLISIDVKLNAGDQIFIHAHHNSTNSQTVLSGSYSTYFNGRLVIKL